MSVVCNMLLLTHHERKVLIGIGILILVGSVLRFFHVRSKIDNTFVSSPLQATRHSGFTTVNINAASFRELEKLPGIGPSLAQRIVAYRSQYGAFQTIDDVTKVKGIGDKKAKAFQQLITF